MDTPQTPDDRRPETLTISVSLAEKNNVEYALAEPAAASPDTKFVEWTSKTVELLGVEARKGGSLKLGAKGPRVAGKLKAQIAFNRGSGKREPLVYALRVRIGGRECLAYGGKPDADPRCEGEGGREADGPQPPPKIDPPPGGGRQAGDPESDGGGRGKGKP